MITRLETYELGKSFGGVSALDDVSLDFPSGAVTAIVGPNGAGKTTLFNVISGLLRPDCGEVRLFRNHGVEPGEVISGLAPHMVSARGVGVLFQRARLFPRLSVADNVGTGFRGQSSEHFMTAIFRPGVVRREEKEARRRAMEVLDGLGMGYRANSLSGDLSFGQQKIVAFARLIANDPDVMLLDEPLSGVHPDIADLMIEAIRNAASKQKVVILIEHNLNVVRRIGGWIYLMAFGKVEMFGKPHEVLRDEAIRRAFPSL